MTEAEDGKKAPRIAANKTRLMEQLRQSRTQLRANLAFLERIGYCYAVKETPYQIFATLRLPPWICTMDSNVLSVIKLDLIHADASLSKRLPKIGRSANCSTKPINTISSDKQSKKHKREHAGSLPSLACQQGESK
jgi:hypothetical protein